MNPKISVIIPNWNGIGIIEDCLNSLLEQTFKDFETIVVDNNSQDDSVKYIKNKFPEVKVIKLEKNFGFAKAINVGVRASKAKYVAFLNNDTYVDKNWLKFLYQAAQKNSARSVASVGPKLLNFYNRKKIDGVGIQINEVGQAKSIGWEQIDEGQYDHQMEVFGVTGGASLFDRSIFITVGLFDENYFMYSEEVDWAFRAQFKGFKALYCPEAVVYHKHKASSKKLPQHLEYWQFRNMTQTIIKDFPLKILFAKWRWLKIILVHFNTYLYQIKNGFFWPPIATDLWIIWHLPQLFISRQKIQSSRVVDTEYIENFLQPKRITFWGIVR